MIPFNHTANPLYKSSHEEKKKKLNFIEHNGYQQMIRYNLSFLKGEKVEWIRAYSLELMSVYLVNLDPIADMLLSLYSSDKRGHSPRSPFSIMRSLLLMFEFKETSITKWAKRVRTSSILSMFCGFNPTRKAPCSSTYYEFLRRLEDGSHNRKCPHRVLPSERRHARSPFLPPKKKPDKSKKKKPASPGVLWRLFDEIGLRSEEPIPNDLEKRTNEILLELGVLPSSRKGLLGNPSELTLAGDGSTLVSGASVNGKAVCACRKKGIYKCDHLRKFSDIDANWGWDNRKKGFVFGYRFYQLVSDYGQHDLPMYISIAPASTHEAVMSMEIIERFGKEIQKDFPQAKIKEVSLDSIHDAYAFYQFLFDRKIKYAIPYSKPPGKCTSLEGVLFNELGVPLCPAGLPMIRHGKDKQGRQVFHCPIKRGSRKGGKYHYVLHRKECPREALCEPKTVIGPILSIAKDIDLRLHPLIPRGSKHYKKLRLMRTCSERSNSMKKENYKLAYDKGRVMPYALIKLTLVSVLEHSRVWAREKLRWAKPSHNLLDLFA